MAWASVATRWQYRHHNVIKTTVFNERKRVFLYLACLLMLLLAAR